MPNANMAHVSQVLNANAFQAPGILAGYLIRGSLVIFGHQTVSSAGEVAGQKAHEQRGGTLSSHQKSPRPNKL